MEVCQNILGLWNVYLFKSPCYAVFFVAKHALTKIAKNIVKVCMEDVSVCVCVCVSVLKHRFSVEICSCLLQFHMRRFTALPVLYE